MSSRNYHNQQHTNYHLVEEQAASPNLLLSGFCLEEVAKQKLKLLSEQAYVRHH